MPINWQITWHTIPCLDQTRQVHPTTAIRRKMGVSLRLLLIEAGGRDSNPLIHIPAGYMKLLDHPKITWGYISETGPDKVAIGTDYPFPWNKVPVDHIMSTPGLSDDDKIAILGGTAAKLLGIN